MKTIGKEEYSNYILLCLTEVPVMEVAVHQLGDLLFHFHSISYKTEILSAQLCFLAFTYAFGLCWLPLVLSANMHMFPSATYDTHMGPKRKAKEKCKNICTDTP